MLAAILFLGLLPLAAMPFLQDSAESEDNDEGTESNDLNPIGAPSLAESDLLEALPSSDNGGQAEADNGTSEGTLHQFDLSAGSQSIAGFQLGQDLVEIDLRPLETLPTINASATGDEASLSFPDNAGLAPTLTFPGLQELPTGDIILKLTDPDTGADFELSLSDALQGSHAMGALSPSDPEIPDDPGTTVTGPATEPADPELPDTPGPVDIVGPVLDPVSPSDEGPGPLSQQELRALIERDSENAAALTATLTAADTSGATTSNYGVGDDFVALPDDGQPGTGSGDFAMNQAAPILTEPNGLTIVDGGAGDDTI